MATELQQIPIEQCIADDEFNTRQRGPGDLTDLTASIQAIGIKEPLLGKNKENSNGEVEIYAGFRRLAAAKEAGLTTVPVVVVSRRDVTRKQMLLINISENVQRADLNPVDEAMALQRLQVDHSMSTDELCAQLGIKKSRAENRFRLLKLKDVVRDSVHDGRVSIAAALEIDRLPVDKQGRFVELAEEFSGAKLRGMIDKELDKLQKKIVGTDVEPKEKTEVNPADVAENAKHIKKAMKVLCEGLGYDEALTSAVKDVDFKCLDTEDAMTLAKFCDDLADTVEEDVEVNDKAQGEIVALVETGGDKANKMYDTESPVFRAAMIKAVGERAQELAREKAETSGKRARVTYAIAREAIEEFFCDFELSEEPV